MSHALYAWGFHFDGIKRVCSLNDKRACVGSTPSVQTIISAILEREHRDDKAFMDWAAKVVVAARRNEKLPERKQLAGLTRQQLIGIAEEALNNPAVVFTPEDIYPVDMHFMLSSPHKLNTLDKSVSPNEKEWFDKNLQKVTAAYGIDADESDTYLVVQE